MADAAAQGLTWQQAVAQGVVTYMKPLPVLAVPGDNSWQPSSYYATANIPEVTIAANDYAMLAKYYADGTIPSTNTVAFGAGISLANLHFSWGQVTGQIGGPDAGGTPSLYTTLNISWAPNQSVQVMIPHASDPLGSGVQEFTFANGTQMTMAQMIALAPAAPTFDPQLPSETFTFSAGMGQQIVGDHIGSIQFAAGITSSDITVAHSGNDLLIYDNNGADVLRVSNWFSHPNAMPTVSATFANGTTWSASELTSLGLVQDYAAGDQTLTALPGFTNTLIASANDTLVGASGHDTFVYNQGDGTVVINAPIGNNTLEFGAGITSSMITLGVGPQDQLVLHVGTQGEVEIDGFVPSNALNTSAIQKIVFLDPSVLTYDQLVQRGFDIYAGTGNVSITGTNLTNRLYGGAGQDTLIGSGTADTLFAGTGVDTLMGGTGQETFVVNNTADVIVEKTVNTSDTVLTSVNYVQPENVRNLTLTGTANLTATGNAQAGILTGNTGNDTLFAGSGNDTLVAGSGVDTLVGGTGNDTFVVNNTADVVTDSPNTGTNTVLSSVNYVQPENVQSLTLTGATNLTATGNNQSGVLTANSGNDTLISGTGVDTLVGGVGNDTFVVNNASDVITEAPGAGISTVFSSVSYTLPANLENLTLTGTANLTATGNNVNDVITGNAGRDTLIAGSGNDTLVAGSGVDTLIGGAGNDTFVVNNTADVVTEAANAGNDTVLSSVSYVQPQNVRNLTLTGSASLTATGNAQAGVLTANAGNDTLISGTGVDTLVGGVGNDTFVVNNTADMVTEAANAGNDTVLSSVSYVQPQNVQNLTLTGSANLTATGNNQAGTLTGNAGNDTLVAGSGNDTLVAGTGIDTLIGGSGHTTFVVNNARDVIIEPRGGTATILSSVSYRMPANTTTLTLTGSNNLVGMGNGSNDVITGNAGRDTLIGGFGNDTLVAGSGIDTLIGGFGSDTFVVNNTADVVRAFFHRGEDTVLSSVSYVQPENVQNLTLMGTANLTATGNNEGGVITGNSGRDTLIAGNGSDTLVSGSGVDSLVGGLGRDTFVVNNAADVVSVPSNASARGFLGWGIFAGRSGAHIAGVPFDGGGSDTVLSSVSYVQPENVRNLTLTGSANLTATGNNQAGILTGNAGRDTVIAGSGNDTLIAGSGVDTLVGGAGNDTFVVNNEADVVTETASSGDNTVFSSVDYVQPENVRNLTLTGTANLTATGNAQMGVLQANSGNDTLISGTGIETLVGGSGHTTFVINNAQDTIIEPWNGTATIQSSVSYVLPQNVSTLTLIGTASVTGKGNAFNDVLTANAGRDTLIAGNGRDTLISGSGVDSLVGGLGRDTFVVNNAADVVSVPSEAQASRFARGFFGGGRSAPFGGAYDGQGSDTVLSSVDFIQPENVQNLTLTGSASLTATGNNQAGTLTANAGNDLLIAGSGRDTLIGGAGVDVLQGGSGWDMVSDLKGPAALVAGSGGGVLNGGPFSDFFAAGADKTTVITQGGHSVIGFNAGDGALTIQAANAADTLSLGGGISAGALGLEKQGENLLLTIDGREAMTFSDWYAGTNHQSVVTLQILEGASSTSNASSSNPLINKKVETFDFTKLVAEFTNAQATHRAQRGWSLANALVGAQLAGHDTAALGGDLAYEYGTRGHLTGMNLTAADNVLTNGQFGVSAQTLHPWGTISGPGPALK
ncbi:calcium-binding protein [Acidiferrobacter thiooxydans]|nr:calcium-binding protein [Acidiferrobacter thiooxydans]UEO01264.1 calcium-binding protein [Acidiferrobacter thiooxydans]